MSNVVKFVEISSSKFNELKENGTISDSSIYFVKSVDSEGNFESGKLYKGVNPYTTDAVPVSVSKEGGAGSSLSKLNFADSWVGVTPKTDGTVDIKFPFNIAKMTASNFNSTGGQTNNTVTTNVSTVSRYVATGGEYPMGNWGTTAERTVLGNGVTSITFSMGSGEVFWIPDTTTYFIVKLTKGDGTTVTENVGPITGNGTFTSTNCSATIENWSDDFMGFKAHASITINFASMLGGAGRFSVEVSHSNGGVSISKTDLFYDDNPEAGSIGSVSMAVGSTKPTKWLSGVEYYTGGLTLDTTLTNITGVFNKSFVLSLGSITSNIASATYAVKDITGSTTYTGITYDKAITSYSKTLTVADGSGVNGQFKTTSDDITIKATCGNGWNTNTTNGTSIKLDKPLNTYITNSTIKKDNFQDEVYRVTIDSSTGKATSWVSSAALGDSELKLDKGTWLVTPDGKQRSYIRYFQPDTGSAMNLKVTLVGKNLTTTLNKTTGYDVELSLDGINWYSLSSTDASKPIFRSSITTSGTNTVTCTIGAQFGSDAGGNQLATASSSVVVGTTTHKNSVFCKITIASSTIEIDSLEIVKA